MILATHSPRVVQLTFFRSAARGLHLPARLTRQPAKYKARTRRASERPRVGCCEELGGAARLTEQPVVFFVAADPEPEDAMWRVRTDRPM